VGIAEVVARLILVSVFLAAGAAKLRGMSRTPEAMRQLGVPSALSRLLSPVLPPLELLIAAGLVSNRTASLASLAAVALLLIFTLVVVRAMAKHTHASCGCFGEWSVRPVGWHTVSRNLALAGLGVIAFLGLRTPDAPSLLSWTSSLSGSERILLGLTTVCVAAVAALSWVLWGLFLQQGRLIVRVDSLEALSNGVRGLPLRTPAPNFLLDRADGAFSQRQLIREEKITLVIFIDPQCGGCVALAPDLKKWQRALQDRVDMVFVTEDSIDGNQPPFDLGLEEVVSQKAGEVAEAYGAPGTPSAVLVSSDGLISSHLASGAAAIRDLIRRIEVVPDNSIAMDVSETGTGQKGSGYRTYVPGS
jgi:uncharacterized membrane protein YphA (DoxX/SURF4 family)